MEHAHITIRLAASALLVGLAATLAGCATPVATTAGEQARAGGPTRVSTEAHLDMARTSAELYVSGLIARAHPDAPADAHREQLQEQAQRYVEELIRRAENERDGDSG